MRFLNKKAKKDAESIFSKIEIHEKQTIADIGCGGGYFTYEFAKRVGKEGKVYAIDTNQKCLTQIQRGIEDRKLSVIDIVLANDDAPILQPCDWIFSRNSFHHIIQPVEYFKSMKKNLSSTGKIAIIDYEKNIIWGKLSGTRHYTPVNEVALVMKEAGYHKIQECVISENQNLSVYAV